MGLEPTTPTLATGPARALEVALPSGSPSPAEPPRDPCPRCGVGMPPVRIVETVAGAPRGADEGGSDELAERPPAAGGPLPGPRRLPGLRLRARPRPHGARGLPARLRLAKGAT